MPLVLRKSYGPWSAGTAIEVVGDSTEYDRHGKFTELRSEVRTLRRVPVAFEHIQSYSEHDKPKSIIAKKDHAYFDIPNRDIVRLRTPKDVVVKNRRQRRLTDPMVIAKRMAFEKGRQ
jgi:hypothetical protein